jgi:hypothetical protein
MIKGKADATAASIYTDAYNETAHENTRHRQLSCPAADDDRRRRR